MAATANERQNPEAPAAAISPPAGRRGLLRPLSLPFRLALVVVGWGLVLLGVIGWFLPVLQGWLTLFVGLAVLSIASQRVHRFLRRRFRRWPKGWRSLEKLRRRMHRWLAKRDHRGSKAR